MSARGDDTCRGVGPSQMQTGVINALQQAHRLNSMCVPSESSMEKTVSLSTCAATAADIRHGIEQACEAGSHISAPAPCTELGPLTSVPTGTDYAWAA
eukprot:scaffold84632_cov33-Tisochrysis_lutea.AAC.1